MKQRIIDYISKYVSLTEDEKDSILDDIEYKTFKKGTHLLEQGQISKECYFNIEGLVRQYGLFDGEEKTTDFYVEGEAIVAFESASKKTPCHFNWICEEDTTLVIGRLDNMDKAFTRNPILEKMSGLFISQEFGRYQNSSIELVTLAPKMRYLNIVENRPGLVNRIPQYHLASYLGIKPETLSRIRKQISQQEADDQNT